VEQDLGIPENTLVVILAAGKGTRMGRSDLVKVCFEIDAVPAINRLITVFKRRRFRRFLLVVGVHADQVLDTVTKEHPGVLYVHQEPQLGTGHAAKVAAEAMQAVGYDGYVLVSMGDKLLEESALEALVSGYVRQRADMALLTVPRSRPSEASAGRVFVDSQGQALDIIEHVDLARQMIADELREVLDRGESVCGCDIRRILDEHIPQPKKQEAAVADLVAMARSDQPLGRAKL
jgi:bifunctional UDP-N-acetylglucosamine pyrophosphorylase/glucosamine-1-phosphate N-acetyltransferase